MMYNIKDNPSLRGIILAGDITDAAHVADVNDYKNSFTYADYLPFVFDGLGNHDRQDTDLNTRNYVLDQRRVTPKTSEHDIQYSWDWHDVHFIQVNLSPADEFPTGPGAELIDPIQALTFIKNDLDHFVHNSGRPVVLIHHYGFDGFSKALTQKDENGDTKDLIWWTEAQRVKYWNAITNYNVVAIFTGHTHIGPGGDPLTTWDRPDGAIGGPDSIPTFTVGAAREGAFLRVALTDSKLSVNRFGVDQSGTVTAYTNHNYIYDLPRQFPIYVNRNNNSVGGGTSVAPYNTVGNAMSALVGATNVADVKITAGNYLENVLLNRPLRLLPQGGTVRVGIP